MKQVIAGLMAAFALCGLAACASSGPGNDGISRFAGTIGAYYGPGSPPRDIAPGSHA